MSYDIFPVSRLHDIHAGNVRAGWWSDLKTGTSIVETRDRLQMIALIISEISEAYEGALGELIDDKLPQYKMFPVELADTIIRASDVVGAELSLNVVTEQELESSVKPHKAVLINGNKAEILMSFVSLASAATEHYRKSRKRDAALSLYTLINEIVFTCIDLHIPIYDIIDAKIAFNANRSDHKIENRKKDGGKAL